MSKRFLVMYIVLAININLFSQIGFYGPLFVSNQYDGSFWVTSADIDGDNDVDIVYAAIEDDIIAWVENLDYIETFSDAIIVTEDVSYIRHVHCADIDGDGDQDIISASAGDDKIAWYENIDGNGDFGEQIIISTTAINAQCAICYDIDNDGDLDVISACYGSNPYDNSKVCWYENLNGSGEFSEEMIVSSDVSGAISVDVADVDSDDDLDIISAAKLDDQIAWHENLDGLGTFATLSIISSNSYYVNSVVCCDIDNDNDPDIVSAGSNLLWFENLNGSNGFTNEQQIPNVPADDYMHVITADLDLDDDQDIVCAEVWGIEGSGMIRWIENYGNGNFSSGCYGNGVITSQLYGLRSLASSDLDNDNDIDLLSASWSDEWQNDDMIAWYENTMLSPTSDWEILDSDLSYINEAFNFPNPFNPSTLISFELENESFIEIEIYDINGHKVRELDSHRFSAGKNSVVWNGNDDSGNSLSSGIYLCRITVDNKISSTIKCILLK